jgi:hypothetical protein
VCLPETPSLASCFFHVLHFVVFFVFCASVIQHPLTNCFK